jgi:hypothetical protein
VYERNLVVTTINAVVVAFNDLDPDAPTGEGFLDDRYYEQYLVDAEFNADRNRLTALEDLTDQAVLETSDVDFNSVTIVTLLQSNSLLTSTATVNTLTANTQINAPNFRGPLFTFTRETQGGTVLNEVREQDIAAFQGAVAHSNETGNPHGTLPSQIGTYGVTPLNSSFQIDAQYLPSYVDDIVEGYYNSEDGVFYSDQAETTIIAGETGKIYVDLTTKLTYRYAPSIGFIDLTETAAQTSTTGHDAILNGATTVQAALDILDDLDTRYYTETELNDGQLDNRYYTEGEVDTLVSQGATTIHNQRFVITNLDNGNGTFSYTYDGDSRTGVLDGTKHVFTIEDSINYLVGEFRVEAKINNDIVYYGSDTELVELTTSTVEINHVFSLNDEVHLKIFEGIDSFQSRFNLDASDIPVDPAVFPTYTNVQTSIQRAKDLIGNAGFTEKTYYVAVNGNDSNDGSANNPFRTIRYACDFVAALPPTGQGAFGPIRPIVSIRINSGQYYEQLPIVVPTNTALVGTDLRTTQVYPATGLSDDGVTNNNNSQMFQMSAGTLAINLALYGMTGWVKPTDIQEPETVPAKGVGFALNPASPIFGASPYILDCSAFFPGGIGVYVDGSVHVFNGVPTGNRSMLFYAYTNINDEGVGFWADNGGVLESVSNFTYYAAYGYLATRGGYIRGLNGSNSWGTWALFAKGFLPTETPLTAALKGVMLEYSNLTSPFTVGDNIVGGTSGAVATILNVQEGTQSLYLEKQDAIAFIDGETLTSATGSATALGTEFGQKGALLVVDGLSALPEIRMSVSIAGDDLTYVVAGVSGTYVDATSVILLTLAQNKPTSSANNAVVNLRKRYSQIRVTGHDFLNVGTGGIASITIGGGTLINPGTPPVQSQQVGEFNTGRVFSVSTDQDGNFRVGKFFEIDQGTGRATLDASAFDLSGLTSLRLGSIGAQLGEAINEFSSDATLSQNSNEKVPTQAAIKTYVDTRFDGDLAAIKAAGGGTVNGFLSRASNGTFQYQTVNVNNIIGDLTLEDATETHATTFSAESTGLNITGNVVVDNNLTVAGNLTVQGTETVLNTTVLDIEDKNIVLGNVTTPSDTTANGGGITLKGATDKTITYAEATNRWATNIGVETPALNIATEEVVSKGTVTALLTAVGWSGSGPYTQSVTFTGMKTDDNPFVDINMANIAFADVDDALTNWTLVYRGAALTNQVTFSAKEIPAIDIPIKIRR